MEKKNHFKVNPFSITNDGKFCAIISGKHLNIYDVVKNKLLFQVKGTSAVSEIKALEFSPSQKAIAWLQTPLELVIVHVNEQKTSNINGHPDFPHHAVLWSPDGQYLVAFSSLSVFIDVYTVDHGKASHIATVSGAMEDAFGKPLAQFSPDGEYFATVNICTQGYSITMHNCKDSSWDCIQRMTCSDADPATGLLWCRDSVSLLVWQAASLRLRLWAADGTAERSMTADDMAAVCCVCLSECGRVAAVLTADCRVRILDLLTWRLDMTDVLDHHPILHFTSARSRLKERYDSSTKVSTCEPITETLYELARDEAWPRKRPSFAQFSADSQYLATYEASYPGTLWVWRLVDDPPLDTVIVLRDLSRVTEIVWHKEKTILAANLVSGRVLVWTPEETAIFDHESKPWPLSAQEYLATLKTSDEAPESPQY